MNNKITILSFFLSVILSLIILYYHYNNQIDHFIEQFTSCSSLINSEHDINYYSTINQQYQQTNNQDFIYNQPYQYIHYDNNPNNTFVCNLNKFKQLQCYWIKK